jgi:hypothetical protein
MHLRNLHRVSQLVTTQKAIVAVMMVAAAPCGNAIFNPIRLGDPAIGGRPDELIRSNKLLVKQRIFLSVDAALVSVSIELNQVIDYHLK